MVLQVFGEDHSEVNKETNGQGQIQGQTVEGVDGSMVASHGQQEDFTVTGNLFLMTYHSLGPFTLCDCESNVANNWVLLVSVELFTSSK